jgi:hypothetical protein
MFFASALGINSDVSNVHALIAVYLDLFLGLRGVTRTSLDDELTESMNQ